MHLKHVKLYIISDFKIISSLNEVFKPFWQELGSQDSFFGVLMFLRYHTSIEKIC